jgi:hypothetical protein
MPEPSDEVLTGLRATAAALDEATAPVTAAEARRSPAAARAPGPPRWLPAAAAAAFVLVVGGVAWAVLAGGDDTQPVVVPGTQPSTTSTTSTTAPATGDVLPASGFAVGTQEGELTLYDFEGQVVGTSTANPVRGDGYEVNVLLGSVQQPLDPAEVPAGCEAAFGGGGVRVALCGGEPQQPTTIDVVDVTGAARRLSGAPFDDQQPSGSVAGHWRWALPSPDGEWVLAQWSGECEVPTAYLTRTDGEGVPLLPVAGGVESFGLGWAPDGRALVLLPRGACGAGSETPGVYLVDPATQQLELVLAVADGQRAWIWHHEREGNAPERLVVRALRELGLEGCCGEPSHGGSNVTAGAIFEGDELSIGGGPIAGATPLPPTQQTLPLLQGEAALTWGVDTPIVSFTCGPNRFTIGSVDVDYEVDSMLLLAEALVPHLYCTLGPPPD